MTYKAIQTFQEKYHAGRVYNDGDPYPAEGHDSTKERIEELSTSKNSYGSPFIAEVVEEVEEKKEEVSESEETVTEIQETETKKGKSTKKSKE